MVDWIIEIDKEESGLIFCCIDCMVNYEWWGYFFNESKLGNDYWVCWEGYVDVEKIDSIWFFVDV